MTPYDSGRSSLGELLSTSGEKHWRRERITKRCDMGIRKMSAPDTYVRTCHFEPRYQGDC